MNGETNPGGSNQNNSDDGDSQRRRRVSEKAKLRWKNGLQHKFLEAIEFLGRHKAVPKSILEYMNVDGITRSHIASHLQKYRKHMRKFQEKAREAEMSRMARDTNFASSSYFNPQSSYINAGLTPENLFQSQLGDGFGQSSLITSNNDSINYMHHDRSMYDLSQTRSNLLPIGQYGTPNDVLGMNSNVGTSYMGNNYAGIRDANGNMGGLARARVNGNDNDSLGESSSAMNWNNNNISNHGGSTSRVPFTFSSSLANDGQSQSNLLAQMTGGVPNSIFATSQVSQVPQFGQYGTTNDVYHAGVNTNEYGDLVGLGGARVDGNVNGSLGENVGTMNWNFNNNNMTNHGSSTSMFSSPSPSFFVNEDQSQSTLNAQTDGLVPILDNLNMCNDHHDIGNTINSQFNQNQDQGQVSAGNPNLSNDVHLDRNAMNNWNFDIHQGQVSVGNPELSSDVFLERNAINNSSFNNQVGHVNAGNPEWANNVFSERNANNDWNFGNVYDNRNEVTLNSIAANSEMYFPIPSINTTNQEQNWNEQTLNSIVANSEIYISTPNMNTINQDQCCNEQTLDSIATNSEIYIPTSDMNTMNHDQVWNEQTLNSIGVNSEIYIPTPDVNSINQGQGRNEPTLNYVAANSEIYIPTSNMNTITQEQGRNKPALNFVAVNSEIYIPTPHMSTINQEQGRNEQTLNSVAANSEIYIPTSDMNTINQEQDRNEPTLNSVTANSEMFISTSISDAIIQDWTDEEFMNFINGDDMP